jgi:hypothetical protein
LCPPKFAVEQQNETSNGEMRGSFTAFRMTASRRERC